VLAPIVLKSKLVQLYNSGKYKCDLIREDYLTCSALYRSIRHTEPPGSFKEKDNHTKEGNRQIKLERKLNVPE